MNIPTHIAAGVLVSQWIVGRHDPATFGPGRAILYGAACFAAAVLAHLLFDLLPHFAWIVHLSWFSGLPYHWLIREAVFGLAVLVPALVLSGRHWLYGVVGLIGGLYPDLEKVAALDFRLPETFVMLPHHSGQISSNDWGLPHGLLIAVELLLIGICLYGIRAANRRKRT